MTEDQLNELERALAVVRELEGYFGRQPKRARGDQRLPRMILNRYGFKGGYAE